MDHATVPGDPAYPPVLVPRLSGLPCAELEVDFETYPARRGWDVQRLLAGDFSQKTHSETAAFLQDWLYFVLLRTVLGEVAQKHMYIEPHDDYCHGRVTTKFLDGHVQAYLKELTTEHRDHVHILQGVVDKVERCLVRLSYFCQLADSGSSDWPLPPEVDLSLRALGVFLSSSFCRSLAIFPVKSSRLTDLRFSGGQLLRSRMLATGWCPSDASLVLEQFSPSSVYYASLLKRSAATGDHSACSGQKCLAFQLDEATYKTMHVANTCTCSYLGPPSKDLVDIIESGRTPHLTVVSAENGDLSLRVAPYKSGRYVCFSHVWSDGLGNLRDNRLPFCQIRRLKVLLDELFDTSGALSHLNRRHFTDLFQRYRNISMPFWIDSLCIPVRGEYDIVRTLAVSRIQDIFRNAYQVMVLDAELQDVCIDDTVDGFMRISLSRWMHRLWTLLEGALGTRVHVKFKNRVFSLDDSYHEIGPSRKPATSSNHRRREASRVLLHGSLAADASMFYWKMRSFRASVVDPEERKTYGYSGTTSLDSKEIQEEQATIRRCVGIMEAFSASRYRTTSRNEDIFLCLGNLLGWVTTKLSSVPVEKRMRLLFESQTILPQGILFVQGPRMKERGWRWAVTGFDDGKKSQAEGLQKDHTPGRRDMSGLTVVYPALTLPESSYTNGLKNVLVSTMNNGVVSWWRVTFTDKHDSSTFSATKHCDKSKTSSWPIPALKCVLFYPFRPMLYTQPGTPMSAAFVSVDLQEGQNSVAIMNSPRPVVCRFIQLGIVEMLRSEEEASTLSRRSDLQLLRLEELVQYVGDRAWKVQ